MRVASAKKIVLLGMMTRMPVGGNMWLIAHYLLGFRRLGYDVYYVEAHGVTPTKLMQPGDVDGSEKAASFIARMMNRFGFDDRWAYHARHAGDRVYGMTGGQLKELYASADVIINLHGGTLPLPEHTATGRLVYLETDPVEMELWLAADPRAAGNILQSYCAMFTWGTNYGHPDCAVPMPDGFRFRVTRPPVDIDLWSSAETAGDTFTTVGNWRQSGSQTFNGDTYHWSKHYEFLKFLDLPGRSGRRFELALSGKSMTEDDRRLLQRNGWQVTDSLGFSLDLDLYRSYIQQSRGEFTVAKDQNVRLRSGWFSERSATYLAAGRPVITQDTGFGNTLPTGEGLFAFNTTEEILDALDRIDSDYQRHSRAAAAIAREYFSSDVVLKGLLDDLGIGARGGRGAGAASVLARDLVIIPTSRWPTTLPDATVESVLASPIPAPPRLSSEVGREPRASIVILCFNNLVFTKLCLASVLSNTQRPDYEVILVDNGSTDGTLNYLRRLASRHPNVRVVCNDGNRGFAPGNNQGLALAAGRVLVLLNNDTIVAPGWLERLTSHLGDPAIGLVGPVTNRAGNEAEIEVPYRTYGELLDFARDRRREQEGRVFDIRVTTMFCVAMRREVWERLGCLDEQFEVGLFEDDDYAMRAGREGYRVVCAEDVFVHHFGQASLGTLGPAGGYGSQFHANRRRWEEKWGRSWEPYSHRPNARYQLVIEGIRAVVHDAVPRDATILVVSRGDEDLVAFEGRTAWHFPRTEDGRYAGHHPADAGEAIRDLETQRSQGAGFLVVPSPSLWWLDHYTEFNVHLERLYPRLVRDENIGVIFDLRVGERPRVNGAASESQRGGVKEGVH